MILDQLISRIEAIERVADCHLKEALYLGFREGLISQEEMERMKAQPLLQTIRELKEKLKE